ncbi:30S ribosome-binding factor RbfA [Hahella sp. SMD15-11]|uniref:Ribosome-binding factor A n=1 Tax=Thermohahella caldifontis TaxID=3142973 RepID=A0AB39UW52_9GAMM
MAREFSRTDRVADQVQRELAVLIQRELKDPRLGMVTVNAVRISKDLMYADVYVTVLNTRDMDDEQAALESLEILEGAKGFLRSELGRRIKIRVMPELRFHYDESVSYAQRMNRLIAKARARDGQSSGDDGQE